MTSLFRLADLDGVTCRRSDVWRRFDAVATRLPAGRVEELWDADLLTVEQAERAWAARRAAGLRP